MGFFSFFSKEKKETLDKGLSKTKESVFGKIARAVAGKSKVDDEVLDNLEEVLITSDVGVETTLKIIERIEKRAAADKYMNATELNHFYVMKSQRCLQRIIRRMWMTLKHRLRRNHTSLW